MRDTQPQHFQERKMAWAVGLAVTMAFVMLAAVWAVAIRMAAHLDTHHLSVDEEKVLLENRRGAATLKQ